MDEFTLTIDPEKFRSTNSKWNELMLNDPWSVGYVSTLIEAGNWKNKNEWEQAYYLSGSEREKLIEDHDYLYFNEISIRYDKETYQALPWGIKKINTQYGRTPDDLKAKGKILYDAVKSNGLNLTLDECIECVRYRVICETWNGIVLRERNTIATLRQHFPQLYFYKSDGETDHTYAVDYQIYSGDKLICALQIKPQSYNHSGAAYITRAKQANMIKNATYTRLFGVPVFTILSSSRGEIKNIEVLSEITNLI